jgi:Raf kinase inhibitor-like YbhB/YbcL family protein
MMSLVQTVVLAVAFAAATTLPPAFELSSTAFKDGGAIPHQYSYAGYGCTGRNISPELRWSGAPAGTKTFALTVFDPDARNGVGWWHWIVYNIPADTAHLATGAGAPSGDLMPSQATQGRNDFQTVGYGGPCPPSGDSAHHYHFTLYALDAELTGLSPLSSGPTLVAALHGHIVGKAELTGVFAR